MVREVVRKLLRMCSALEGIGGKLVSAESTDTLSRQILHMTASEFPNVLHGNLGHGKECSTKPGGSFKVSGELALEVLEHSFYQLLAFIVRAGH